MTQSVEYLGKVLNAGIKPCGNRIVVYPIPKERKTASGIVIPDEFANREDLAQIEAVVVDIGGTCWANDEPWCKVGDIVLIAKYSGYVRKGKDMRDYRVINDKDVVAIIEDEEND